MTLERLSAAIGAGLLAMAVTASLASTAGQDSRTVSPAGLSSLPSEAQAGISAALGRDISIYHVRRRDGLLRTTDPRGSLDAEFVPDQMQLKAGGAALAMRLTGYGRASSLKLPAVVAPVSRSNRVEYRLGPMTEWYVNGPLGLEQGFTFARRPGFAKDGALTVALSISGNVTPAPDPDANGLTLMTGATAALRYAGLSACDASGRKIHAWLEVRGNNVLLRADDAHARYPVTIDPRFQIAKLTYTGGSRSDSFGYSTAISGATIVVGAPFWQSGQNIGRAYIFEELKSGWASMTQTATLSPSDNTANDEFGTSVAVQGNTIAVGMLQNDQSDSNPTASHVYIFVKPKGGWVDGTETAKLVDSSGWGLGAAAISGRTIVAGIPTWGVPNVATAAGAADVFVKPKGGWAGAVDQIALLYGSDYNAGDRENGSSVAISGKTIVTGDPDWFNVNNGMPAVGAAYIFVEPAKGWASKPQQTQTSELSFNLDHETQFFGNSVSIDRDTVAIGAPEGVNGGGSFGSAYIFVEPQQGWGSVQFNTSPTAEFAASDAANGDSFGHSVALDGGILVAGAPYHKVGNNVQQGAIYQFVKPRAGWTNSTETHEFTAKDGSALGYLGYSVGLASGITVGGEPPQVSSQNPPGAAYVFKK
jgi:hypothetical protein